MMHSLQSSVLEACLSDSAPEHTRLSGEKEPEASGSICTPLRQFEIKCSRDHMQLSPGRKPMRYALLDPLDTIFPKARRHKMLMPIEAMVTQGEGTGDTLESLILKQPKGPANLGLLTFS